MNKKIIMVISLIILIIFLNIYILFYYDNPNEKESVYNIKLHIISESPDFNPTPNETGKIIVWLDGNELLSIDFFRDDGHNPRSWELNLTKGEYLIKVHVETINVSREKIVSIDKETDHIGIRIWYKDNEIHIWESDIILIIM